VIQQLAVCLTFWCNFV